MTNRERLKQLRQDLGITQTEAAALLSKKTHRPCSLRTVMAWETDPSLKSARTCPDWAVEILTHEVERLAKRA
jgi:DNA-binding XRE family transcriptional regulator